MLSRGQIAGGLLHHRCACDDWGQADPDRTMASAGRFNMEQCDPDPFMNDLNHFGLPWQIKEFGADEELLQH